MRVNLGTHEFDDEFRRALRRYWGRPGLATRKEIADWALAVIDGEIETALAERQTADDD